MALVPASLTPIASFPIDPPALRRSAGSASKNAPLGTVIWEPFWQLNSSARDLLFDRAFRELTCVVFLADLCFDRAI